MTTNRKEQLSLPFVTETAKYEPNYQNTKKIDFCLDNIERERYTSQYMLSPKYEGWLRRRAFIRSGHHSLHIEGNILTEEQVADILENPNANTGDSYHEEDVRNWNRAMQFVDSMSTVPDVPLNTLLIRQIHALILGPDDRIHLPGDYRRGDAKVRHPISRKPVYTGPVSGDVPDLMHQFGTWLVSDATSIHPVVAAGIAHLRFVEIHPFVDGNGRTARALTTLILQRGGYSFNKLLALERYFDVDLLKYCEAISATVGKRFEEGRDLTEWLEYFSSALSVEVTMASNAVIDLRRMMERWHSILSQKGYVERHRDILAYARINNSIRPRDVTKIAGVSAVTASSDLKRLVGAGLLDVEGQSRARVFRPSENFWETL
ncbi:MAG TPA: Fic family protein [Dehalococcoidia bacterium]|nr:Fic family protein [Dehalococcoidia bacterium]